jgi:hypothetical protein
MSTERPTDEQVHAWLDRHFPIEAPLASIELVDLDYHREHDTPIVGPDGELRATLRLIVWSEEGGQRSIRDVKEKHVRIARADHLGDVDRLHEYLHATRLVVAEALEHEEVECCMPDDFIFPEVLGLKRPRHAQDFCQALSVDSRLGSMLGG